MQCKQYMLDIFICSKFENWTLSMGLLRKCYLVVLSEVNGWIGWIVWNQILRLSNFDIRSTATYLLIIDKTDKYIISLTVRKMLEDLAKFSPVALLLTWFNLIASMDKKPHAQ